MKRLLYCTDLHITDRQPPSRKDCYHDAIHNKLDQINRIAIENNVDMILCGGDVCDRPQESYSVYIRLFNYLKNTHVKWKSIIGFTHDFAFKEENIKKSILWALQEVGVIELLSQSYDFELEGVKIHSSHQSIVPTPFYGPHVLYSDFKTEADLVLCSHIHYPYGASKVGKTTFIAPGSLARNTSDSFNLDRIPQVVLIELNNNTFTYKLIELECSTDVWNEKYLIKKSEIEIEKQQRFDSIETIRSKLEKFKGSISIDQLLDSFKDRYDASIFEEYERLKKEYESNRD